MAIGRAGPGWAGPIVGRAKTGPGQNWPGFSGQNFNSPACHKNWAGRAKYSFQGKKKSGGGGGGGEGPGRAILSRAILGRAKFGPVFFGPII